MRKFKFFLGYVLIFIIILVIASSFVIYYLSHRALPDYNRSTFLNGLSGTVEVYRDSFAIPHIYAKNEDDLYRVVGYLTAQDRLWQMDLLRRVTTGRLSEIFGSDLLKTDILMRSLRIPEKSKKVLAQCPFSMIRALEAYSDGVNQYIKQYYHKLPIEFTLLRYKPETWTVEHSVNLIGYMAWDLNGCWNSEIVLHKLAAKLKRAKLADFIPGYDSIQQTIFSSTCQFTEADWRSELIKASSKIEELGLQVFHGSNNWVVSGTKTVSGKPILANDMHLGFSAPGIWYQIHQIVQGKINVSGVILPGQPFVISGHNDSIAWGLTNVMNDDIDFYKETLRPDDSTKYRFNGKWKDLTIKHETFSIKGGHKVYIDLKFTHRGPIISMLKNIKDETISMHWMGNEMSSEIQSIYMLNRARNWSDFCNAMKTFKSVSQNVAYADHQGNIGMYCCAGVPIRKGNPIEVMPGDTSAYDWQGVIPFQELPHKFNPSEGFAVSANNRTIDFSYPHYISSWFDLSFRYDRISEMLNTNKKLTVSDIAAIQTDFTSKFVSYYLPGLIEVIKKRPDLTTTGKLALKTLANWRGQVNAQSKEAAIFEVFYNRFIENTLKDELGDTLFKEFLVDKILVKNTIHNIWCKKKSVLCDDISTSKTETFADMVVKSFNESLKYLEQKLGPDLQTWEWGKIHLFTLEHPLSKVKILDRIFHLNRGPFEVGGSFHTVAPYSYRFNKLFEVNSGASQRHIYDFADWDNSISVIPTGNCGIPSSPHYCDQTTLYLAGQYHKDLFSINAVKNNYRYKAVFSSAK